MEYRRRDLLRTGAIGLTAGLAGCTSTLTGSDDSGGASIADEELTLSTTTSTYDTGLLDEVNAAFSDRFGVEVAALPQGTGDALRTAEDGDADAVLVHARSLEDEFMREGYGVNRRDLMFNDFVIVGPTGDPAGIGGSEAATDALVAIADSESAFVSRGDESGTHTKELALWEDAGVEPGGEWYQELGDGMGNVLNNANEQDAYALSDRGTFLSMRENLDLEILVEGPVEGGPESLMNPYGIVAVNPEIHPDANYQAAMAYIGFLTSTEGQEIIEEFTVDGEQLFFPEALSEDPNFQQYVPEGWQPDGNGDADDESE